MPLRNSNHDLLLQRRLTEVLGEHVTHYPVIPCSCRGTPDQHPLATCKVCGGSGRAYGTGTTRRGLVASIANQDKALLQAGLAMPGDLTFSPDVAPTTPIHDYDVIRLGYPFPYEGDVVTRGQDTLIYTAASIRAIQRHDPQTGNVTTYSPTSYELRGNRIIWASNAGPSYGLAYTVSYEAIIDWVVYPGVTLPRVHRGTRLGQRVLLRKRHLAQLGTVNIPGEN